MREPIPATPTTSPRRLIEPDSLFIADIAMAVRAGASPVTAAIWLGVSAKQFHRWRSTMGEPYDSLRSALAAARAHLQVKLQAEVAKRNPGRALKNLNGGSHHRDADDESHPRLYQKTGATFLGKRLPSILARISDDTITDLSPLEQAAKSWRDAMIDHLGGLDAITPPQRTLLATACGSWILLSTLDSYCFELAATGGLVSRKHRQAFPVVEQRARLADSLVRQLQTLGIDRKAPPVQTLAEIIDAAKTAHANGNGAFNGNAH
jgi:hypothetical protein